MNDTLYLTAFRQLLAFPLRTTLTALGVVIGTMSVIIITVLGDGLSAAIDDELGGLGFQFLSVTPGEQARAGVIDDARPFDMQDVDALRRQIPGVASVSPLLSRRLFVTVRGEARRVTVSGVGPEFFRQRRFDLASGRLFDSSDLSRSLPLCVVSEDFLSGDDDDVPVPTGLEIRIDRAVCHVVGVTKKQSVIGMAAGKDTIYVPLPFMQSRIAGDRTVSLIQIEARADFPAEAVIKDVQMLLRERRNIRGEGQDFRIEDMNDMRQTLSRITTLLTATLGSVALVSLLVGGIGIMNIMLVSVTERTREIGIRLAIGAMPSQILVQFMIEAMMLAIIGGLSGAVIGLAISAIGCAALGVPFIVNYQTVALTVAFTALVGLFFGILPARRAASMMPAVALRQE
ncbi:ABC transporter permease [Niveispirillum lacus]|uniref:ABC transporter permease n=1 Tax=Niveispirillum lacus TaxID=1981099 RepID=UPI0013FDDA51|nr:ABC transporter permease [Niveispirillum lacus]